MQLKTIRDVQIERWGGGQNLRFTVPAGTKCKIVGGPGGGYAVESEKLVTELCGDAWEAEHHYVWINPKDLSGNL
jgi:hypothetical protein